MNCLIQYVSSQKLRKIELRREKKMREKDTGIPEFLFLNLIIILFFKKKKKKPIINFWVQYYLFVFRIKKLKLRKKFLTN